MQIVGLIIFIGLMAILARVSAAVSLFMCGYRYYIFFGLLAVSFSAFITLYKQIRSSTRALSSSKVSGKIMSVYTIKGLPTDRNRQAVWIKGCKNSSDWTHAGPSSEVSSKFLNDDLLTEYIRGLTIPAVYLGTGLVLATLSYVFFGSIGDALWRDHKLTMAEAFPGLAPGGTLEFLKHFFSGGK